MKRLFLALTLSEADKLRVDKWRNSLSLHHEKQVAADNLHMTLVFLGATNAEQQSSIERFCQTIACTPITLALTQLSYWQKPKILALTTDNIPQNLITLEHKLANYCQSIGFNKQHDKYRPHITLCRKAQSLIHHAPPKILITFDSFCLYESINIDNTIHYVPFTCWQLTE